MAFLRVSLSLLALAVLFVAVPGLTGSSQVKQFIKEAIVIDKSTVEVSFRLYLDKKLEDKSAWKITPGVEIASVTKTGGAKFRVKLAIPMKVGVNYAVQVGEYKGNIDPAALMDTFYSDKVLGMSEAGNSLVFRVFVPRGMKVMLCLFNRANLDEPYKEIQMTPDDQMVFEASLPNKAAFYGQYYGYRIFGPESPSEHFNSKVVVADPYSKANVQKQVFPQPSRSIILSPDFTTAYAWGANSGWTGLKARDAVIYEVHVRDMTMHSSSGTPAHLKGTYAGFTTKIPFLKKLGINALEMLPVHDIGNIEPPYRKSAPGPSGSPNFNDWNPYAWNHWGYMTSSFFAVESLYSVGASKKEGTWNGVTGSHLKEFKQMVQALHQNGIALLMDVVYNHVAQYDLNSFKFIDSKYYLVATPKSGCGNDFYTKRPMARKLILDSVKYFVNECKVDGYRFDLAGLVDFETGKNSTAGRIKTELTAINPNVILIAEPWGGTYCPAQYSDLGWSSWNDQIRNTVRGSDGNAGGPGGAYGFMYGKLGASGLKKHVTGTLRKNGGLFVDTSHAINYLASHDNNSLGDHMRIDGGRQPAKGEIPGKDIDKNGKLTEKETRMMKLGALVLYTCQGGLMILAGQESAQSKVVHPPDPAVDQWNPNKAKPWTLDHDSYEKDNETNWYNFNHVGLNQDLFDYHCGLAAVRAAYRELRWSDDKQTSYLTASDYKAIGWVFQDKVAVLANGNPTAPAKIKLPDGAWKVLVDDKVAGTRTLRTVSGEISVPALSGMVLVK